CSSDLAAEAIEQAVVAQRWHRCPGTRQQVVGAHPEEVRHADQGTQRRLVGAALVLAQLRLQDSQPAVELPLCPAALLPQLPKAGADGPAEDARLWPGPCQGRRGAALRRFSHQRDHGGSIDKKSTNSNF